MTPNPACSATPAPLGVSFMAPIYTYMQTGTVCGGGFITDQTAAQDLLVGLEYCHGDSAKTSLDANCYAGGDCRSYMYVTPTQLPCGNWSTAEYTNFYNTPSPPPARRASLGQAQVDTAI